MMRIRILVALWVMLGTAGLSFASDSAEPAVDGRSHQNSEPVQVSFLFYIMDISQIDAQDQSFSVSMFVQLRWTDERLAHSDTVTKIMPLDEVWNPRLLLANQQGLMRKSLPEEVEVKPTGEVTYHQRYIGAISQPIHLHDFPRDTHNFSIQFISSTYGFDEVAFVPDIFVGPEADSEQFLGAVVAERLSLADWEILKFAGEAHSFEISNDIKTPGFAFNFTAERHFNYYFWQMILPQILIVMMSWAAFWINPSMAGTQISLSMSAMLTLIAHRFILANQLPKLPYLTRMDIFIMLGTVLVFAAFFEVVITSSLAHGDRGDAALRIDRWSRFVFPLIFICFIGFSFWM